MRRYNTEMVICKALTECEEKRIITPRETLFGYVIDEKAIIPFGDWIEVYDKEEFAIGKD